MSSSSSSSPSSSSFSFSSSNNKNNNNNHNNNNNNTKPTMTDDQFLKSWGGMYHFMLSYGLKIHDEEDYRQAKEILRVMKEAQLEDLVGEWTERERERAGGKGKGEVGGKKAEN